MTIEKVTIKVREETTSKIYEVEMNYSDIIDAVKYNDKAIWLYIDGWIKAAKELEKKSGK